MGRARHPPVSCAQRRSPVGPPRAASQVPRADFCREVEVARFIYKPTVSPPPPPPPEAWAECEARALPWPGLL